MKKNFLLTSAMVLAAFTLTIIGCSKKVEPEKPVLVSSILITPTGDVSVEVGKTTTLSATVSPSNAANQNVTWSSLDTGVATVSAQGVVTGVSVGSATIRAVAADGGGVTATKVVSITAAVVLQTGITITPSGNVSVEEGETTTLVATVAPSNATNKNVTWSSLDTGVATVNDQGVVTGVSAGTATIKVTAADGSGVFAEKAVTVFIIVHAQTPVITEHPQDATYTQGATPTDLSVTASVGDGGTLSYQWYRNTTNTNTGGTLVGTNNTSFTPPTTTAGVLYYYVVVTNTNNDVNGTKTATATSTTAAIIVTELVNAQTPTFSVQPSAATYPQNATATALTVTASITDGGTLSYQWYRNATNTNTGGTAVGTNSASFTPPTTTAGTLYYYVVVTNTNNSVNGIKTATATSTTAAIIITELVNAQTPTISVQPQAATYAQGVTATALTVTAAVTDGGTLSYRWFRSSTNTTSGGTQVGTNSTYTPVTTAAGTLYYYVVVTNTNSFVSGTTTATATSVAAAIIVTVPTNAQTPSITVQPQNATYTQGATATALTVTAAVTDGGTLSFRWYRNSTNSTTGATLVGTNSTYTPVTTSTGTLYYYVVVTNTNNNASGTNTATATSTIAAITVNVAKTVTLTTTTRTVETGNQASYSISTTGIPNGSPSNSTQWFTSAAGTTSTTAPAGLTHPSYNVSGNSATKLITTSATTPPGTYYFKVTIDGTQSSNVATLIVTAPLGSAGNPFIVSTPALLRQVGTGTNGWGRDKHYRQTADISLSGTTWTRIGSGSTSAFTGTYDGQGYYIGNLTINSTSNYQGMFGYIGTSGVVRNVALRVVSITNTTAFVGGVAGFNYGTIENCYVTGTVTGSNYSHGGVVGVNYGVIKNCYATCEVLGTGSRRGGIVGQNYGTVQFCFATRTVEGTNNIGGIVGENMSGGTIERCVALNWSVKATSGTNVGRVAGANSGTLNANYSRSPGMELLPSPGAYFVVGATTIYGANVSETNSHGSGSALWWPNTAGFSSSFWNSANDRPPHLRTTTGGTFSIQQSPQP